MIKSYTVLKKGDFLLPQCIESPEAKEVIFTLICDGFTIESKLVKAIDSSEALINHKKQRSIDEKVNM